jgi:ribosomal protein L11 methylase PrmA
MTTRGIVPGSFRDPSGFLFSRDGQMYRQINAVYRAHYDQLIVSGLYESLTKAGLLIPHREVEIEPAEPASAYKVIQPEQILFISYPYEWSFSQLKDAALTTLAIQKRALEFEMSLKDCSAYNIQFRNGRPIFIDTLSFEAYREGKPWVAYRQFCQHFLAPLALMSYRDVRLSPPLDLASSLLPVRTRFSFALLSHIHLHAKSQIYFAARPVAGTGRSMRRMAFRGLIDSLERAVLKLRCKPQRTEWVGYLQDTNYSEEALQHKEKIVSMLIDRAMPQVIWDLGANTGFFSRLAAAKGIPTISLDVDPACVEINYQRCVREHENSILPLLLDITNPSPGIGWENEERMSLIERGPADVVLALALLHHLAISNNLPFDRIAGFFARLCHWLIIEFIPKNDSQVQRLLLTREDVFPDYTQEVFERSFEKCFVIQDAIQIQDSGRIMYLMERKRTNP